MEGVPFFFSKFVQRMSLFVAHSVALNPFCQGLLIRGEADINAAAR